MFFTWSSQFHANTLNAMAARDVKCILVGIERGIVEVVVGNRAKCLHVQLAAIRKPVEAACHEMTLVPQATFRHLDSGGARHQVIGIFDAPVPPFVVPFLVTVAGEFEK